MNENKSAMWRVKPSTVAAVDALRAEAQEDPVMAHDIGDSNGHISRAAMLDLCLSRGMASVRGALRARPEPAPKPTPTKPAPKARKPAKRKKAKR